MPARDQKPDETSGFLGPEKIGDQVRLHVIDAHDRNLQLIRERLGERDADEK